MFNKLTTFSILKNGLEVLTNNLDKSAMTELPDGIKYDPDFFYMKVRAVSAGEYWGCNKNADYFPEEELKKSYDTFLNAHAFKNHENKDVANAIGDVLTASWDDAMKCIVLLLRIDKRIAPTVVRGFEKGFMTDVSMGCRIEHSLCSICGNKAKVKSEYCDHINTMRLKVFPDGKKVYEINIGPKFHDISAVLNGAERPAKVTGILITGSKVAFHMPSSMGMEKAASSYYSHEDEKIASIRKNSDDILFDNIELFAGINKQSKKDYVQKIAELKKVVKGKIVNMAKGEVILEKYERSNKLRALMNLLYNSYWDKKKCIKIADQIKEVACRKTIPISIAFDQFLKVLDFAGIELSPAEFESMSSHLSGLTTQSLPRLNEYPDPERFMNLVDKNVQDNSIDGVDFPSVFRAITRDPSAFHGSIPEMKTIIIRIKGPQSLRPDDDLAYNDMMNIVKDDMPQRSVYKRFLIKRIVSMPDEAPNDNYHQFLPAALSRSSNIPIEHMLSSILYSLYQRNRADHIASENFNYGLEKFASYIEGDTMSNMMNEYIIEKSAGILGKGYSHRKAAIIGLPLVFGYSALQRARMKNGENVNGINRYIAENPGNAFLIQAMLGPYAAKGIAKAGKKTFSNIATKARDISDKIYSKASEESDTDIFKNASIDSLLKKQYTDTQISAIKLATVLMGDREDKSDEILSLNKLSTDDIDAYLQICKDCIKIEVENEISKTASQISDALINAGTMALFNPVGTPLLATLPGHLVDGAVFKIIDKKVRSKSDKNKTRNIKQE